MGGSHDTSYRVVSSNVEEKLERALEQERDRLKAEVNDYLAELLVRLNDRDVEAVNSYLDAIHGLLGDKFDVETVLLGGSVAKHTDVTGISDVDALVALDADEWGGKSPQDAIRGFRSVLERSLQRSEVESVSAGRLAVTVKYCDGTEIQLLPAIRERNGLSIPSADGRDWNQTKPKVFASRLTAANSQLGGSLIPAIKLTKSLLSDLPRQKQLSGYHVEAIALDAATSHRGPKTVRDVMLHILSRASERVLQPMRDTTRQSRVVDGYLGERNSLERRNISQTLAGIHRRLDNATSLGHWKASFGD